jgi:hypothetical protein
MQKYQSQERERMAITQNYLVLRKYLGAIRFEAVIRGFLATATKQGLPAFLANHDNGHQEWAELAILEEAVIRANEARFPLANTDKPINLRASCQLFTFNYNTTGLWSSLICDEVPPRAYRLEQPCHVLVWRQGGRSRMRILGEEEFVRLLHIQKTAPAPFHAAESDAAYLRGWLDAGLFDPEIAASLANRCGRVSRTQTKRPA